MADWADTKAQGIVDKYVNTDPDTPRIVTLINDIAAALRQAKAEARQTENEKCRELIEKRVGDTRYQDA